MALRGLSPPTSDQSTEDETRAIMVEIPNHVSIPNMLGLSSMLTPETSPANSGLLMNHNGNHGKHMTMGSHSHLLEMNRVIESPLPVIEAGALEAYLHHVESEGCIPVFGLRSDLTNVSHNFKLDTVLNGIKITVANHN